MNRRHLLTAAPLAATAFALRAKAAAPTAPENVRNALQSFVALPVAGSCLVVFEGPDSGWEVAHDPDTVLFVGSAFKTFVLAECLRAVERGTLSEDDQWAVDDSARSFSSPVFENLSGATTARSVLEAMMTHSDNTATDIALAKIGPDNVRGLVAEVGLKHTTIPDSTRRFLSYIAGAAPDEDIGWAGLQRMLGGWEPGQIRFPVNNKQSMLSNASDLVEWYQRSLRGAFFAKPETLTEFKRIQSSAESIAQTIPSGIAAYAKGGSLDWDRFHCFSLPGQMVSGNAAVTFCFTINWVGPNDGVRGVFNDYRDAVSGVLKAAAESFPRP